MSDGEQFSLWQEPGATWVVNAKYLRGVENDKTGRYVYIGRFVKWRPTLKSRGWGNPYYIASEDTGDGRRTAITQFLDYVLLKPDLLAKLPTLRGKRLVCWCAGRGGIPGTLNAHTCHGEILAYLADHPDELPALIEQAQARKTARQARK